MIGGLIKRLLHKPDEEADKRLEVEILRNEKQRRELHRRMKAVEVTMPVGRRPRGNEHDH